MSGCTVLANADSATNTAVLLYVVDFQMPKHFAVPLILLIALTFARMHAQTARQPGAVYDFDVKGEKPGPAPVRDISGTWEPAKGVGDAIQANGAKAIPSDGKPEHALPFTPAGEEAFKGHKAGFGVNAVATAFINDPMDICDPQGWPRIVLHNFRTSQIVQTPNQVLILYEFNKKWRVIWTDGRTLPKDPDPRWWGYSAGKWVDNYTFVAQTVGLDDRTWLDNAGRPHSDAMRVEERYHRVDRDHLEMTITIDDPKMYTKPWVALDKLSLRLQPQGFDIMEMECSPSETAQYNKKLGDPGSRGNNK
jgi:hypothetical protein